MFSGNTPTRATLNPAKIKIIERALFFKKKNKYNATIIETTPAIKIEELNIGAVLPTPRSLIKLIALSNPGTIDSK